MRKRYLAVILCFISLGLFSCGKKESGLAEVCGYISIDGDQIKVDTVEWITDEDEDRIRELGLSEDDLIDGYYILNESSEIYTYKLSGETQYNFIDWNNDFVSEGEERNISTTNKEDFIRYLNTYSDQGAKLPFFIVTEGDVVKSITEKPLA
jgi:hypothetical protein